MTADDERRARIHLGAALEPGDPLVAHAVTEVSAMSVRQALLDGYPRLDPDGRRRRRLTEVDVDAVLERGSARGLRFLSPDEPGWPASLASLHGVVRESRGGPPLGLWVRGHIDAVGRGRSVAVVGSRAATGYGSAVATEWAARFAEASVDVVSGAAYGIDAAAHRGCLAVGGTTVAVLACGCDQAYPKGNAALLERICDGGALVSEAAPGSPVTRSRFLTRNRLIAALAAVTVVVEAGARSGALSTARWAQELNRTVAAVPGPVTSSLSLGPHQLLRETDAVLTSRPEEVVELVGDLGVDAAARPATPAVPTDALSTDAALVHEALPARRPITVAELIAATGMPVAAVISALTELLTAGLVAGGGDVWRRARATRP